MRIFEKNPVPYCLRGQKTQTHTEISARTYRSVIAISREGQKAQLVLNFFAVTNHLSPKLYVLILSSRSQVKSFYNKYNIENHRFCSLR